MYIPAIIIFTVITTIALLSADLKTQDKQTPEEIFRAYYIEGMDYPID
jgi:hypothetical protein